MNKLIIYLAVFLFSCASTYKATYKFKVVYTEGSIARTVYTNEIQWLENGCLGMDDRVVCGDFSVSMVE